VTLGERLRKRRKTLKISQQELAEALGVTAQHISALEQGKRTPSLPFLAKLAEELGVSIDYLLGGEGGFIRDIVPVIKADRTLPLEVKRALIALIKAFRGKPSVSDGISPSPPLPMD